MKVRSDMPQWLVDNGYKTGVEIGVYKGEFTEMFCQAGVERIYAIDPWAEYLIWDRGLASELVPQKRQDFLVDHAHRVLDKYPNCTIVRKSSMDALGDFTDGSLDFVYIDANHSFVTVAQDIYWWSRKVRSGGVVSGHDYTSLKLYGSQVRPVVDAYVQAFDITTFRIIGSDKKSDYRRLGDNYHSWMWVKE